MSTDDSKPIPSQPENVPATAAGTKGLAASAPRAVPVAAVPVTGTATAAAPQPEGEAEYDEFEDEGRHGGWLQGFGACSVSMIVHIILLLFMAVWVLPEVKQNVTQTFIASPLTERPEDEPAEFELDQQIEVVTESTSAVASSSPAVGLPGGTAGTMSAPSLDAKVVEQFAANTQGDIKVDFPTVNIPTARQLIAAVPEGEFKGDARAIVDDYQQAMDRITQELMWMLDKGHVLVIWVFDQSESMKDDQKEIRDRVDLVYSQLGIAGRANGDALLTSVTSFGENYVKHTAKPTANRSEIRAAIDAVPNDPSGKENLCTAIGKSIADHRQYCRRGERQMALVLVTDESGERDNNERYLEAAIAEAKSAGCRIYVLGREGVFGYPYAHIRWLNPQTKRVHWLQIDRGPETAFVEQLQTNGFHRRYDAFSSGFGPWEQVRMAWETGGIFFMLPSVEADLVQGEKRRYDLELMRPFRPDLRPRQELLVERDKFPLRTLVAKIINDLNPYNPAAAKIIDMRVEFSPDLNELVRQARIEQQKAIIYLRYLAEAQKALEKGNKLRQDEAHPRWQANYDLILGQIIAYQARIYEYGVGLEEFIKNPKDVPRTKPPNLVLDTWDIGTRKETLTKESQPYIERATELLQAVAKDYPGTPWAARAQWELARGFGVHLVPDYEPPLPVITNPIPIPKL